MADLRMDTVAFLRAPELIPTVPAGSAESWEVWGTSKWVAHRELMVLLWSAAVCDLSANGFIRLFDTDHGPAVDLVQPIDAPLDAADATPPSSIAFDVRFGIISKLKNDKRFGVQAAQAVGIAAPELTVKECARWGNIHAREEARRGWPLAPHLQLEKLGAAARHESDPPKSLWAKVKASVEKGAGRPTVADFAIDQHAIQHLADEAEPLLAEVCLWLETPNGSAVSRACAAAYDGPSPRSGQDPRV